MSIRSKALQFDSKRIVLYAVLVGFILFYLSPLESGLMTSFKTQTGFYRTSPVVPPGPDSFTLDPWSTAFSALSKGFVNSLLFAVPATIISAVLGSFTAYGLTNIDWRGQVVVLLLLVAGVFIPYQAVLVPLTLLWSTVGLSDLLSFLPMLASHAALIELAITHIAYGIPICTVLFRGYYVTIDTEMLEAAKLDGASAFGIYRRIILPQSRGIFAVVLIYQFTQIWNDLLFALVLINLPQNQVVTLALSQLQGSMIQQFNIQMAGAFIAALPPLVLFILFTEQFAEGITGES